MKKKHPLKRITFYLASGGLLLSTVLCLFPPPLPLFKWWEAQAPAYMLFLLSLGLFSLFVNYRRFMLVAFGGCALMCYVINERTESIVHHPDWQRGGTDFSAAYFKMPGQAADLEKIFHLVTGGAPDLLSLQGIPPSRLEETITCLARHGYPHVKVGEGAGSALLTAVFSRHPFDLSQKTNGPGDAAISGRVRLPGPYASPFLQFTTALPNREQASGPFLDQLAGKLRDPQSPTLALGDFHCVPWSMSLSQFKKRTQLHDSRRMEVAANASEYMGWSKKPTYHILYSSQLECLDFNIIRDTRHDLLGVVGSFRLSEEAESYVSQKN